MIGRVIEGRYVGSGVYKLPEKNVLFIQTDNGEKIALSKRNAISIEDVTAQYSSDGRKTMMVMWNDFETSIIQFGSASPKPQQTRQENSVEKEEIKKTEQRSKGNNILIPILCCITIIVVIIGVILCMKITGKNGDVVRKTNDSGNIVASTEVQPTVAPTTEPPQRTKDDAILEAQTAAIKKASNELKKKLKNPSSLVINDAKFYYPDYDEENMVMNYAAVKLDYNATNSYGGSVRDTYTYFLVDIETLSAEQVVHIGMN